MRGGLRFPTLEACDITPDEWCTYVARVRYGCRVALALLTRHTGR